MASKGPRSKLDHETRARRQRALEAPRESRRPKAHWDHVLEEMAWLSKDFESEEVEIGPGKEGCFIKGQQGHAGSGYQG